MQKYSFLFILITSRKEEEGKSQGSRSAKSLVIDMKVKILACNVESLVTDSKSVQVLLRMKSGEKRR